MGETFAIARVITQGLMNAFALNESTDIVPWHCISLCQESSGFSYSFAVSTLLLFFISFLSFRRGLSTAAHEPDGEEDCRKWRLLWTLPWHPAQFHEGHTGCEHQLRGVWVHAVWLGHSKVGSRVICDFERRMCSILCCFRHVKNLFTKSPKSGLKVWTELLKKWLQEFVLSHCQKENPAVLTHGWYWLIRLLQRFQIYAVVQRTVRMHSQI